MREPKKSAGPGIFRLVEAYGDIASSFFIQEVDASKGNPGIGARQDVLYGNRRTFRVDAFIHADPDPSTD